MKPRKIILLSACAVLFVIAIVQIILGHKNPVKVISLKDEIDEIKIERPDGELHFKKGADFWVVGDKEYRAKESSVDNFIDIFSSVKILNKVTKTDNSGVLAKYNLDAENVYTVTVYNCGKVLRTFYVGKTSSTNSQTYMRIDNSNDIYLVSGAIQYDCEDSIDDVRSKVLYEFDRNDINTIVINKHDGNEWALSRSSDGSTWSVSGADGVEIDSEKANSWYQTCASVSCNEWLSDDARAPGELKVTATIMTNGKSVTLDLFESIDEEGDSEYWGECSEMPYAFKTSLYIMQRFNKSPSDFE